MKGSFGEERGDFGEPERNPALETGVELIEEVPGMDSGPIGLEEIDEGDPFLLGQLPDKQDLLEVILVFGVRRNQKIKLSLEAFAHFLLEGENRPS